jgi:hypothetical protein
VHCHHTSRNMWEVIQFYCHTVPGGCRGRIRWKRSDFLLDDRMIHPHSEDLYPYPPPSRVSGPRHSASHYRSCRLLDTGLRCWHMQEPALLELGVVARASGGCRVAKALPLSEQADCCIRWGHCRVRDPPSYRRERSTLVVVRYRHRADDDSRNRVVS